MRTTQRRVAWLSVLLAVSLVAAACGDDDAGDGNGVPDDPANGATDDSDNGDGLLAASGSLSGRISGAGATFPTPLYQDWIFEYADRQPDVNIDYQSIGSGGGIEQFLQDTVDWGTSERYLRDDDLQEAVNNRGCEAVQVPMVYGSVVIAFGDSELDEMILDAETISAIFQREITNWNDERLAALNPDRDLPDRDIIAVHRSDGSGTTSVFTTWLEDEDEGWTLGSGTEVDWPAGTVGGQGNEGVTALLRQEGGVGYVNQAYALENDLAQSRVINADGNAVYPTLEATTEAIEGLEIPDTFQFDILGVGGGGFPITGTAWNFYYTCGYDEATADVLKDFWTWATQTDEGDALALELGYAPLGASLKERVLDAINRINEEG